MTARDDWMSDTTAQDREDDRRDRGCEAAEEAYDEWLRRNAKQIRIMIQEAGSEVRGAYEYASGLTWDGDFRMDGLVYLHDDLLLAEGRGNANEAANV